MTTTTTTLRSEANLAQGDNPHFPIQLGHNLTSSRPKVVRHVVESSDVFHSVFVDEAVEAILHAVDVAGRSQILVSMYTHACTMTRVLTRVVDRGVSVSIASWKCGKTILTDLFGYDV